MKSYFNDLLLMVEIRECSLKKVKKSCFKLFYKDFQKFITRRFYWNPQFQSFDVKISFEIRSYQGYIDFYNISIDSHS